MVGPARRPHRTTDYLASDEQLNLVRAFGELYKGLEMLSESRAASLDVTALRGILDRALAAYRSGEDVKGALSSSRMPNWPPCASNRTTSTAIGTTVFDQDSLLTLFLNDP